MPIRSATVARTTPAHARTRRHSHKRAATRHARVRVTCERAALVRWHRPARPAVPPHTKARIAATHLRLDDDVLSPSASSSESMATPASRAAMDNQLARTCVERGRDGAAGCHYTQVLAPAGGVPSGAPYTARRRRGCGGRECGPIATAACVRARLPAIASGANPTRGARITACGRISARVFRLGRDLTPWTQGVGGRCCSTVTHARSPQLDAGC